MATHADQEIELKLELSAAGADALEASGLFGATPRIVEQHAVYFDTPDHDLARAGLSLRIRRSGERRVQTVKAGAAAAGMFVRSEWEFEVDSDAPALDDRVPVAALVGDKAERIAPLFTVRNERRLWDADGIEIALDRGSAIAGRRKAPICEVELEAKGGDAAALFALARRIGAVAPVQLGVLAKSARGYALLEGHGGATKAEPVDIGPAMDAAAAFEAIALACLRHFRLNAPLVGKKRDAAALHQARVALRRLRSALAIFKPMVAGRRAAALDGELRWLAGELGPARDLDVLGARAGKGPLADRIAAARTGAYAKARAALASDRARAALLDVAEWVAIGGWRTHKDNREIREMPARDFAAKALGRLRRKVKKRGRNLAELDDAARHELRKSAKKLRYAADFFAPLYSRKRERRRHAHFLAALEALQDRLGALNDRAAAPDLLRRLGLADDPQAAALLDTTDRHALIEAAAEAQDALADAKRFWR